MEAKIFGVSGSNEIVRFMIEWEDEERGFGQIEFIQYLEGGSIVIDSELMDRPFIKLVLNALVDGARVRGEPLDKTTNM